VIAVAAFGEISRPLEVPHRSSASPRAQRSSSAFATISSTRCAFTDCARATARRALR
jgi:hypothetical protein